MNDPAERAAMLAGAGVAPDLVPDLLQWTGARIPDSLDALPRLPLPDTDAALRWRSILSGRIDACGTLARCFPALGDVHWIDPDGICIRLAETCAGTVPLITVRLRDDFLQLLRRLAWKTPPAHIPDSLGAMFVAGCRNRWFAEPFTDQVILLSSGPYAALPAAVAGWSATEWPAVSVRLRAEHELVHFVLRRMRGKISGSLTEDVIADALACRAIGAPPALLPVLLHVADETAKPDERWAGYVPSALQACRATLRTLVREACINLAAAGLPLRSEVLYPVLATLPLELLAGPLAEMERRLHRRTAAVEQWLHSRPVIG